MGRMKGTRYVVCDGLFPAFSLKHIPTIMPIVVVGKDEGCT